MGSSHKKLHKQTRRRRRQLEGVFKLIFDYIVYNDMPDDMRQPQRSAVDWLRELQPLTAVCHSWRQATLPLFYKTAVCSVREIPYGKASTAETSHGALIRDPKSRATHYSQRSNVGLIFGNKGEQYVCKLVIELFGDVAPDAPVSILADAGFNSSKWLGIDSLRIAHWHGNLFRAPTYSSDSLARLNLYLLHALPHLSSIKYRSVDDRRYYQEFPLDGLLASTLSRLKEVKLVSGLIPDMGSSAFLPGLVSLNLRCPILADAAHLPMIFAETLENLDIGFSSVATIWNRFYSAGNKRSVKFKRLKTLVLEFMEPADAKVKPSGESKLVSLYDDCYFASSESSSVSGDSPTCTESDSPTFDNTGEDDDDATLLDPDSPTLLQFYQQRKPRDKTWPLFPKLQSLSISKYPDSISRILRHFPIESIQRISIRDISRGWSSLNATAAARLSSLRVHISPQRFGAKHDEYRYQAWINRLFSVSSSMVSLQLDAPTSIPISLPDVIGLTCLSTLSFSFRIDLGTVPNLLSRLPYLKQLAMHVHPWSSWSHRYHGLLDYGDYEMLAHIPPLSRSLRKLVAYVGLDTSASDDQDCSDSMSDGPMVVERELAWLLARVPSLRLFKTEEMSSKAIRACIDDMLSYKDIVPHIEHLLGVEIEVWKY
ncbi:hypothetical protein IWW52_002943 [Coemansia sp. RSA 2704]|nr:hypothetical protein IWW52_002943 [Coemansia sp. RSA 2704]